MNVGVKCRIDKLKRLMFRVRWVRVRVAVGGWMHELELVRVT